jgi:hypothetical protein
MIEQETGDTTMQDRQDRPGEIYIELLLLVPRAAIRAQM